VPVYVCLFWLWTSNKFLRLIKRSPLALKITSGMGVHLTPESSIQAVIANEFAINQSRWCPDSKNVIRSPRITQAPLVG
jgi:hypothetical protein